MTNPGHRFPPGQLFKGPHEVYEIVEAHGQGGFGEVYLGARRSDGEPVLLKVLRWERVAEWKAIELFEREAEILKQLDHPNIPAYLDSFPLPGPARGFLLIQEFVEGRSLRQIIDSEARLSPEQMLDWFRQLLDVCGYLHRLHPPVIHRDIKPDNIILREDGRAFLIDFGSVQAALLSEDSFSSTAAGTFGYAPMEQFLQRAVPQSDLYGLAMTFVAVSTKRDPHKLPFLGNRLEVREALEHHQLDPRVLPLLEQMTNVDPEQRPASAQEVLREVEWIIDTFDAETFSQEEPRRLSRRSRAAHLARQATHIPMPESFRVQENEESLTISWRWFQPLFFFLLFFFLVWDSFLFFWYSGVSAFGDVIFMLVPLIHVAVGIGGTYYTIAGFFNTTTITADHNRLSILHAPLPWPGSRTIELKELEQLFCIENAHANKNGNVTYTYEVHAIINGSRRKLIGRLNDPQQAHFIEQRLEAYLGIADQPVLGELEG